MVETGTVAAHRLRWPLLLGVVAVAARLGGCWLVAPPAQGAVRTARLLPAFFVDLPVEPEAWGREPPLVSVESLPTTGEYAFLHIYRPPKGRHPALLLS